MELGLICIGISASIFSYIIGLRKGKKDGYTVGRDHGMLKANELIAKEKALAEINSSYAFTRVKGRLPPTQSNDFAWIG